MATSSVSRVLDVLDDVYENTIDPGHETAEALRRLAFDIDERDLDLIGDDSIIRIAVCLGVARYHHCIRTLGSTRQYGLCCFSDGFELCHETAPSRVAGV